METKRVNEIDLLRFAAALSVVFFHYAFRGYAADDRSIMPYPLLAPIAKYAYLGVELFFLISGFVILMTASRGNLKVFAISRFVRLYPAFWACCTLSFVLILLLGGDRYSASFGQYLVNMTMLSGFVGVPSIDGVYWSLFVELQFYGLVAALMIVGRIHQAQFFLVLWLIVTALLEMFPIGPLRFLLLTNYAVYFIAGAMCFLIWSRGVSILRLGVILACLAIALRQALGGLSAFETHYGAEMNAGAVAGIIIAFFAIMLMVATRRTGSLGHQRWLTAGALTYPLYLIHQYVGFMIFNVAYPAINQHLLFWGTLLLMLGVAYAVHVLVERQWSPTLKKLLENTWDGVAPMVSRLRAYAQGKFSPVVRDSRAD
ncbi:MAG: acyltransferase family protein [Lysobacter sp.]